MTENASLQLWIMRAGYLSLGLMIIFFQLLPLQTLPSSFAGPDLIVAFTFAWAVRRPDHVPALSIAALMLTADMLFQRPPGLAAALTVLATQALKRRAVGLRDQTFAVEWLTVGVTVIVLMLSARMVLSVLLIPQAPLGLTLMQTVMTVIAYPPAAAITAFVFGVQKQQPGDADAIGGRT